MLPAPELTVAIAAASEERATAAEARADHETATSGPLPSSRPSPERLAALTEERSRPWWRRIAG